jgi:serine O-acetyltransferase
MNRGASMSDVCRLCLSKLAALMASHKQPNAQRTHGAAQMPRASARWRNMNTLTRLLHPTELPMLNPLLRLYRSVQKLIEQISEDWAVNHRDWTMPGFRAIAVHRFGTWVLNKRPGMLRTVLLGFYRMLYRYIRNTYGIEIPLTVVLGRRLLLAHQNGLVFHWKTVVGDDCLIRHNATIGAGYGGAKTLHKGPHLENRVEVGPGAVIFAAVTVGEGAVLGPNVVVMSDVPAGARVFAEAPRMIRLPHVSRTPAPLKTMPQHM